MMATDAGETVPDDAGETDLGGIMEAMAAPGLSIGESMLLLRTQQETEQVNAARLIYDNNCATHSTLGQGIKVLPRPDESGFIIVTTRSLPENHIVTAFPMDLAVVAEKADIPLSAEERIRSRKGEGSFRVYPFHNQSTEVMGVLAKYCIYPVKTIPPISYGLFDPNVRPYPQPDRCAHWVEDICPGGPYEGLRKTDDALPALAQATVGYLQKSGRLSNVRVVLLPALTALMTVRPVLEGEKLLTGKTPQFYLGDPVLTRKVARHIVGHRDALIGSDDSDTSKKLRRITESDLCTMMGL